MSLLKRHTKIADYVIIDTLSDIRKTTYRTIYLVQNSFTQLYAMTVYDVDSTPAELKSYKDNACTIREFERRASISSNSIPGPYEQGSCVIDGKELIWMCCRYFEPMALPSHIKTFGRFDIKEATTLLTDICIAVCDIAKATNGGGHYNITPENILIGKYEDGERHAMLTGLIYASEPCNGRPSFPTKGIDMMYRAPETFLGRFSQQSDIYSLGIIFAYMVLGAYPWDSSKLNHTNNQALVASILEMRKGEIDIPDAPTDVNAVLNKALARGLSTRYKTANALINNLSRAAGLDALTTETDSGKSVSAQNEEEECRETAMTDAAGRPSSGVVIKKAKGNGYADVAGMNNLKSLFRRNFIDIVNNLEMAKEFQITPANGALLFGAPGIGKSFIVQKTAEEAGLNYTIVKPSDLASIYIHGSQSMIADVFKKAEKMAPVLLCFDEIDAMVPARTADDRNNNGGEVNEFLTQLDNCAERGIYVMGTTNRPDRIDKAVLRKGRFDELIYVPMPDLDARKAIFDLELQKRPHDKTIDTSRLAQLTENYTSSDISYIVKEAARVCFESSIHNEKRAITPIDQQCMESVISRTSPSVSRDDVKRYEQMEKEMTNKKEGSRPRVGFMR